MEKFNLSQFRQEKVAGPKRIKDRGIKWVEHYGDKSATLKKRFDKTLGPMSYMRWEGHDYTTDSDYFVVVGPAMTEDLKKRFFAGIKKLPKDPEKKIYAPSGEYFSTIRAAFSHASDKWAIPFPKDAPHYTLTELEMIKIPRHVKGETMKLIKTSNYKKAQYEDPDYSSEITEMQDLLDQTYNRNNPYVRIGQSNEGLNTIFISEVVDDTGKTQYLAQNITLEQAKLMVESMVEDFNETLHNDHMEENYM